MPRLLAALPLLVALTVPARAGHWPAWRGPEGDGHTPEKALPTQWSPTENVRWKIPLPEGGNSTPAIWGDRVFLTQATDKGTRRLVMCFNRADGKLLWQKETRYPETEPTHDTNPYCSASPVTDGERLVASLGSAGLVCHDFAGKELWRKDLGKMAHIWGNASSPILYHDLAILSFGPGKRQFLIAVNKRTGATVWQHDEPGGNFGDDSASWRGSWCTPLVIKVADHDELIVSVPEKVRAFDPQTGKELWSCGGVGKLIYTSPVYGNGIVVVMSGYGGPALAVRAGGFGDVTQTHRLWHQTAGIPQRIGSPVIVGDYVYIVNEPGTAWCFALTSGKEVWRERVSGKSWGSLVATADGRLYVTDHDGATAIFEAGPKYKLVAKNSIGEHVLSSVAVSDGELFLRTYKHLWCIGK
jgi:outer membrane protein assembly factor BamB